MKIKAAAADGLASCSRTGRGGRNWGWRGAMISVKVSADGAVWTEALVIARATGRWPCPRAPRSGLCPYARQSAGHGQPERGVPTGAAMQRGSGRTAPFALCRWDADLCPQPDRLDHGSRHLDFPSAFVAAPA
ncbi:hypothetical protein ACFSHQ_27940 [Gemmobacter lanyuensis]